MEQKCDLKTGLHSCTKAYKQSKILNQKFTKNFKDIFKYIFKRSFKFWCSVFLTYKYCYFLDTDIKASEIYANFRWEVFAFSEDLFESFFYAKSNFELLERCRDQCYFQVLNFEVNDKHFFLHIFLLLQARCVLSTVN